MVLEFAKWAEGLDGASPYCTDLFNNWWYATDCSYQYNFLCSVKSKKLSGKTNVTMRYSQHDLDFRYFQVWYTYQRASYQLLESWEDKRMTGVQLRWKIENPTLEVSVNNVGDAVQTPKLERDHKDSITYKGGHS